MSHKCDGGKIFEMAKMPLYYSFFVLKQLFKLSINFGTKQKVKKKYFF